MVKKILCSIIGFTLPSFLVVPMLKLLGYDVGKNFTIGFSILFVDRINIGADVKIGHGNILLLDCLIMKDKSYISNLNLVKGYLSLVLEEEAALGQYNRLNRSKTGITYGFAEVRLGKLSKITAGHFLDVTRSIRFGDYSTLAGIGSQLWTHGYVHENKGRGRFRVDGEIYIGDNVYIGSRCVFNPGVEVSSRVTVGSNSSVSKSLYEPGMYVSQPLRRVDYNIENIKSKLTLVQEETVEIVFEKKVKK